MVSARKIVRSPITWTFAVLLIVGLGVGSALAQPWRLFTNTTVNEAAPTAPGAPTAPRTLAQGTLVSHEHDTSGTVRILRLPDGSRVLRLEG